MQRGSRFSLAAALFGWPHAPGHAAPEQHAPDSWLVQFREHHAVPESSVLNGLFTACTSGRDWVLEAAPKVTLTLDTTVPTQEWDEWNRRINTLRPALSARGVKPLGLTLLCNASGHTSSAVIPVAVGLADQDTVLTALTVSDAFDNDRLTITKSTDIIGEVLPERLGRHLTTLTLNPCPAPLPPPELPQLRSLSVTLIDADIGEEWLVPLILPSIAPYLTQLSTLEMKGLDIAQWNGAVPWADLTTPAPSHTLTSFSTDAALTDALVSLMLTHMPALESVRVQGVSLQGDHSETEWGVRELTVTGLDSIVPGVCRLPRCKAGAEMTVKQESFRLDVHSEVNRKAHTHTHTQSDSLGIQAALPTQSSVQNIIAYPRDVQLQPSQ